ncbi:hypothetical protein ANCCEY_10580 [Ancylostoma ceylanicum]|uniref:Fork-head domain-containing protein n=1 Tax=Ancylostoma ceylanicum TaxID=53326 RepID=A0A0D6LGP0_9BILA|nr:hypothetical protein ANCCEY_10580 [Ancylostoma ceylanicum]
MKYEWMKISALNALKHTEQPYSRPRGLSVLLSACAPPLNLDEDFGLGWDSIDPKKDVKDEQLDDFDSFANSPLSHLALESESSSPSSFCSLELDCDPGENSLSVFPYNELPSPLLGMPDPMMPAIAMNDSLATTAAPTRRPNPSSAHGRHWRQSIRHCLMSSAVFVRVLTPNPRKDFLVMNEAGSWWTVHPDCEAACADEVFRPGVAHRCPPNGGGVVRMKMYQIDDTSEIIYRDHARGKWTNERIYARRRLPLARPRKNAIPLKPSAISLFSAKPQFASKPLSQLRPTHVNPQRGDHFVIDHEEEDTNKPAFPYSEVFVYPNGTLIFVKLKESDGMATYYSTKSIPKVVSTKDGGMWIFPPKQIYLELA